MLLGSYRFKEDFQSSAALEVLRQPTNQEEKEKPPESHLLQTLLTELIIRIFRVWSRLKLSELETLMKFSFYCR